MFTDKPPHRNNWDEVSYIIATVVDANGVNMPAATNILTFSVQAQGVIAATDNAGLAQIMMLHMRING